MKLWRVLVLSAALVAAACGDSTPKPEAMDPVSADEAKDLAARFEKAMTPCDPAALAVVLDLETIVRRAAHAADLKTAEREQVYKGMTSAKGTLTGTFCGNLAKDAEVRLLRIRDVAGKPTPLFRVKSEGGINYYELELGKARRDHQVRVIDMYVYVAGERLSDTFARLATTGVKAAKAGSEIGDLKKIGESHRNGDDAEAIRLMAALPAQLRDSKQMRLLALQLYEYDDPEYQRLLNEFEAAFPGDPSIDMVGIDGAFFRKDLPGVLAILDRLEKRVGGDPYLDFLRLGAYQMDSAPEHLAEAEKVAHRVAAAMPEDQTVRLGLINILVKRRDFPAALTEMEGLTQKFDVRIIRDQVAADPDWQALFASPEFAARGADLTM